MNLRTVLPSWAAGLCAALLLATTATASERRGEEKETAISGQRSTVAPGFCGRERRAGRCLGRRWGRRVAREADPGLLGEARRWNGPRG
jgi:hypothetical protein